MTIREREISSQRAFRRSLGKPPIGVVSNDQSGGVLLPVILVMVLFSAIAIGAALVTRVEVIVAERFRQSAEALYAAQAAMDVAISELRGLSSWTAVVDGVQSSRFAQGSFAGWKAVPGNGEVNVCCDSTSAWGRLSSSSQSSPAPARRALVWRPFLWTSFDALAPQDPPSHLFVIVFVANDEDDADAAGEGDRNGTVLLRADALDPGGLQRTVEALVRRSIATLGEEDEELAEAVEASQPQIGVVSWREVR